MLRWLALGFTLICMGSCSFISTSPLRGVVAPIGVVIGSLVTMYLFVSERVAGSWRPESSVVIDPEVQALLRKRAAEKKVVELRAKLAAQQQRSGGSNDGGQA